MQLCSLGDGELSGNVVLNLSKKIPQDNAVCDAKGRDCIEMNAAKTFNCSTTCVGMHADVQWHEYKIEDGMEDSGSVHSDDTNFLDKFDEASAKLLKRVAFLEEELKMLKRGFGFFEKRLEKSKMLIAEYRKFKAKNVKHFRFKLENNSGNLVRSVFPFCIFYIQI